MRRAFPFAATLCGVLAAGCGDDPPKPETPKPPKTAGTGKTEPKAPEKLRLLKAPPLTEDAARAVLHEALETLEGDDGSRAALLYMADLGDRKAVNAIHAQLLAREGGEYADPTAAAIGFEALLAFGETNAAADLLALARRALDDDALDLDQFLVSALGRVTGDSRGEAVQLLVRIAEAGDDWASAPAVDMLAQLAAPEARELFATLAADTEAETVERAAAVAGLLRLGDPRGKDFAEQFLQESESEDATILDVSEILLGFAIEGAVETVPYIRRIVDRAVEAGEPGFEVEEGANALVTIHAQSGGAELIPWLQQVATVDDGVYELEAAWALWALGDDTRAQIVAEELVPHIVMFDRYDPEPAVDILDAAARRRVADKPPFREIVDAAAQLRAAPDAKAPVPDNAELLRLAAAHAFLRSVR